MRASYILALLMAWAPNSATEQAKSTSSMVNSRGSAVTRRMTPMTLPLATMGMATMVAIPSSLASLGYCMRGSLVASKIATGRPLKASVRLLSTPPGPFCRYFSLSPTAATSPNRFVRGLTSRIVAPFRFIISVISRTIVIQHFIHRQGASSGPCDFLEAPQIHSFF